MKKASKLICVLLILVIALSAAACGNGNKTETTSENTATDTNNAGASTDNGGGTDTASGDTTAAPGGTGTNNANAATDSAARESLTVGTSAGLGRFLDYSSPTHNMAACDIVYDSFFTVDLTTGEMQSRILDDWYYEDDTTFIMTLKKGVYFTDGAEATVDDLLFSLVEHWLRDSPFAIGSAIDFENCYIRDENTVVCKFLYPYGPGLYNSQRYLFQKAWCEQVGWDSNDWYDKPMGTGPYVVTEYVTDDYMKLVLKENYWGTEEYDVKEWIIKNYSDPSVMFIALEKGEIDVCTATSQDYSRWLKDGSDDYSIYVFKSGTNAMFTIGSVQNPMFEDINLRKAIAYGVDWNAIGEAIMGDLYTQATSALPSDSPYYVNVGTYEYNPELAKQILADAGYKDGDVKIYMFSTISDTNQSSGEAIQYYLSQLGIELELEFGDMTSVLAKWMVPSGTPGASEAGWVSFYDGSPTREPTDGWGLMFDRVYPYSESSDAKFLELARSGLRCVDTAKRHEIFTELQQYFYDNYLGYPVYEEVATYAYRTDVLTEADMQVASYSVGWLALHLLSLKK